LKKKWPCSIRAVGVRTGVLAEIQQFRVHNPTLDSNIYRKWLVVSKQRYEDWLARR